MTMFVSYAQQQEDVMLWRALGDVPNGCYVDVGANSPIVHSVTKAFYERGWRGINIDPVEAYHRELMADRPEDVNLLLAASDECGTKKFHVIPDTGLSTSDEAYAARHVEAGFQMEVNEVQSLTLDEILRQHPCKEVHFLKIDVEGAEKEVLQGLDLTLHRPWIIMLESCEPNRQVSTHGEWEHLLTGHGYLHVYSDGINRFYLAQEHAERRKAFIYPPNLFDQYVRREVAFDASKQEAGKLRARLARVEARLQQQVNKTAAWKNKAKLRGKQLDTLQGGWLGKLLRPVWKRRLKVAASGRPEPKS